MTKVTVELEDLEALVFSTGVIKNIEGSLDAWRRDPFSKPKTPLTDAHNRLATAMRNARRGNADTIIKWDEALDKQEVWYLREIADREPWLIHGGLPPFQSLIAKGMAEIGTPVKCGVWWPGAQYPELTKDILNYAVRLTPRGRAALPPLSKPEETSKWTQLQRKLWSWLRPWTWKAGSTGNPTTTST